MSEEETTEPAPAQAMTTVEISNEIMEILPRMMRASGNPHLTTNEFFQVLLTEFAEARSWELEFDNPSPFSAADVRVQTDEEAAAQPGGIFAADRRAGSAASASGNDVIMDTLAYIQGSLYRIEMALKTPSWVKRIRRRLFGRRGA